MRISDWSSDVCSSDLCNDPEKDPDYTDEAPNALMAWYKTWYNRQPRVDGSIHAYKRILAEMGTPEAARSLKETMWLQLFFMAEIGRASCRERVCQYV